jgi:hypothetical protein
VYKQKYIIVRRNIMPKKSVEITFWENVDQSRGPNACWLWKKSVHVLGYGRCSPKLTKSGGYAHRYAYLSEFNDIPDGMHVFHSCNNRSCCNPIHLYLDHPSKNRSERLETQDVRDELLLRMSFWL